MKHQSVVSFVAFFQQRCLACSHPLLKCWLVFREQVDAKLFMGALAIMFGAVLLSFEGDIGTGGWGVPLIALACLS